MITEPCSRLATGAHNASTVCAGGGSAVTAYIGIGARNDYNEGGRVVPPPRGVVVCAGLSGARLWFGWWWAPPSPPNSICFDI